MGLNASNPFVRELEQQLVVVADFKESGITLRQDKYNQNQFLIKKYVSMNEQQYRQELRKLEKKKQIVSQHVARLVNYSAINNMLCARSQTLYIMYEYPHRNMDQEICKRFLQRRKFQQKELWSILASCILGLSILQKHSITHKSLRSQTILLSKSGVVQIADPYCTDAVNNYQTLLNKRSTRNIYLAPELCDLLAKQQIFVPKSINPYKADAFTLGMIVLQISLLEFQNKCYANNYTQVDWVTLKQKLIEFGERGYSEELKAMLEVMLQQNPTDRQQWSEMSVFVKKAEGNFLQQTENLQNSNKKKKNTLFIDGIVAILPSAPLQILNRHSPLDTYSTKVLFDKLPNQTLSLMKPVNKYLGSHQRNNHDKQNVKISVLQKVKTSYQSENVGLKEQFLINSNTQSNSSFKPHHLSSVASTTLYSKSNSYQSLTSFKMLNDIAHNNSAFEHQNNLNIFTDYVKLGLPRYQPYIVNTYETKIILEPAGFDLPLTMVVTGSTLKQYQNKAPQTDCKTQIQRNLPQITNLSSTNDQIPIPVYSDLPSETNKHKESLSDIIQTNKQDISNSQFNDKGQTIYVIEHLREGSRYEGEKVGDFRQGIGKFFYKDGGSYDGEWVRNKMQGKGKLYYKNGKLAYDGYWSNDMFQGDGILYNQFPKAFNRLDNSFTINLQDDYWIKFKGSFKQDLKQGQGIVYFQNEQYFEGNFIEDVASGPGEFHQLNGTIIKGVWSLNQLVSTQEE